MLTKVTAHSAWTGFPPLVLNLLERPETDLFEVLNIDGLGPVTASVNTSQYGTVDGEAYNGSNVGKRNIVFTMGFNPDWADNTYSSLRTVLSRYFSPKQNVRLVFESDERLPVEISGYVESNEPNIFSKDPENQISIICPEPHFVAVDITQILGLSSDAPLEIDYVGTVETGMFIRVSRDSGAAANVVTVALQRGATTYSFVTADIVVDSDDDFFMQSIPKQKFVRSLNSITHISKSLLHKVQAGAIWPTLEPGLNLFDVTTDFGLQDVFMGYYERYGGL